MGKDFAESVRALGKLGIPAIEFWTWWDKDLNAVKAVVEETGVTIAAFCTKFISLVDKGQRGAYLDGLKESVEAARKLGCRTLISQTGNDNGYPRETQMKTMAEGLSVCAPVLRDAGVTLVVEPLNQHIDHAGYFLSSSVEAFALMEQVSSPFVKVLFDVYHQQTTEGNIINHIAANIGQIGHFHAAGLPGRHELYTGELNYPAIFRAIDATGYSGYVGLEYFPVEDALDGLKKTLTMLGINAI